MSILTHEHPGKHRADLGRTGEFFFHPVSMARSVLPKVISNHHELSQPPQRELTAELTDLTHLTHQADALATARHRVPRKLRRSVKRDAHAILQETAEQPELIDEQILNLLGHAADVTHDRSILKTTHEIAQTVNTIESKIAFLAIQEALKQDIKFAEAMANLDKLMGSNELTSDPTTSSGAPHSPLDPAYEYLFNPAVTPPSSLTPETSHRPLYDGDKVYAVDSAHNAADTEAVQVPVKKSRSV